MTGPRLCARTVWSDESVSLSLSILCHQWIIQLLHLILMKMCLHTQCECIILFLCVPDLHVTLLVRAVPIWWLKSFSYESMWNSRCVDVFSEREVSQFSTTHCTAAARSCTLLLMTVINASASDFIKCLLPLAVHKLWAHDLHSLWRAWQASFVSTD